MDKLLLVAALVVAVVALSGCLAAVCGDGVCEASENDTSCPADCEISYCGDGACGAGETPQNCSLDCGPAGPVCGDGVCEVERGETRESCRADCGGIAAQDITYGGCDVEKEDGNLAPELTAPNYSSHFWAKKTGFGKNIYINLKRGAENIVTQLFKEPDLDYAYANDIAVSEVGQYSVEICEGDAESICCVPMDRTLDVRDLEILSLYPEHNNRNADRINVILVGSGYGGMAQFRAIAEKILSIGGEPTVRDVNAFLDSDCDNNVFTRTREVDWGFFSVEPLKSNKDKFNIWYLSEQLEGSLDSFLDKIETFESRNYFEFSGLDFVYPALIVNGEFNSDDIFSGSSIRSHAFSPSFKGEVDIDKENIAFGISYNSFLANEGGNDTRYYSIFSHESGHALFGLSDEYAGDNVFEERYPNCAASLDQAQGWWGDLVGEVDPFYYEYRAFMAAEGFNACPEEYYRVQYVNGGCGVPTEDTEVRRPTTSSIMRTSREAVFGSVNRRRAEQVLNLFSGD